MKLSDYKSLRNSMLEADKERDKAFEAYQDMYHGYWRNYPAELQKLDWSHKVVSSIPHDAIATAVRVIPSGKMVIHLTPLASDQENKDTANMIERMLGWQLKNTNRRRSAPVQADYMQSACLYATIAAQVIDVPWQIKQMEANKGNAKRWKAALRYGRFMIPTYNPMDVHVQYSNFMPERVLLCQVRKPQQVADEWPAVRGKLKEAIEAGKNVNYFDMMDYDEHCIWCEPEKDDDIVMLEPQPHELPFLNWVALMGGSALENKPEYAYHSLLYSVYHTGQWESQNSVDTLRVSEAIKNAAKPPLAEEGPNPDNVQIDALSPLGAAKVPAGNTLKDLPPNMLDPALTVISDAFGGRQTTSTVSQILMSGETAPGTAFAAMNLQVLTAIGALKPHKELTERALAETFVLMLEWVRHTGEKLTAMGVGKNDMGTEYELDPGEVPENLYFDVDLRPDTPTDLASKANVGIMLKQAGLRSDEAIMEELGVEDPQTEMEQIYFEQMTNAYQQIRIQQMMQDAMGPSPEELAAQQANAAAAQQTDLAAAEGAQNPGGMMPAQLNPNATREMANQRSFTGEPLAEGMMGI